MKTVIEMAREAGAKTPRSIWPPTLTMSVDFSAESLQRFAEMVRADEREKYKWDVHSCGPTCKRYACVAMREAVEAEREACARLAERSVSGLHCAAAIRARGDK